VGDGEAGAKKRAPRGCGRGVLYDSVVV